MSCLDGMQKRAQAMEMVERSQNLQTEIFEKRQKADKLLLEATTILTDLPAWESDVEKFHAWDKEDEAKKAGADFVGLDEFIDKIKNGWTDVDVIITMPAVMGKIGALGKVLGPRGLMPNPKSGTVTMDIGKAVSDVKKGKIDFKVDKTGIVHAAIGKVSFDSKKISENASELIQTINKLKPTSSKGTYLKSITLSSTMGVGLSIDTNNII